jgi:hypothetical protein
VRLYEAAKAKGLKLATPYAAEIIQWINEWHCEGVKIRYEFGEQRELPTCEALFPLATEIIQEALFGSNRPVDYVSPLNAEGKPIEVHSVGIRTNPLEYAKSLVNRDRKHSRPDKRYLIELQDGSDHILSADDILKWLESGRPAYKGT